MSQDPRLIPPEELDFDNLTPKQVREWGKSLVSADIQFREIRATLVMNCEPGRQLCKLGITYDQSKTVLSNLVHILSTLLNAVEMSLDAVEAKKEAGNESRL